MQINRNRRRWVLILALILLLGALLRLYNINKESFWADEGWAMILAKGPTVSDVVVTMANDQHPPLYFVLLHWWIDLTSNSEVTTRLLSTFWSLIEIAAIFRLGADVFSPEAGIFAALLLALADNDTYLAQEARHYTQMAAFAILSTLFYFRYLKSIRDGNRSARLNGVMWLLTSSALMYTHYLGGFILIIQLLHTLIFVRPLRRLADMVFRWGAICLTWLPWAFVFINQSQIRYTKPILSQSALPNNANTFTILRGDLLGSHFGLTIALILIGFVYITYQNGKMYLSARPIYKTFYMVAWLLIPTIVMIGINPKYPIVTPRNFLLITPVIALLVAHGLANLDRRTKLLLVVIIVTLDIFTVDAYFIKPPYRQVAQDILKFRNADDPMLLDVWTDDFALSYHIGRDLQVDPATLPILMLTDWRDRYGANYYAQLLQYLSDKNGFWLAYWGADNPDFQFFKDHGFVQTAVQVETHLDVNKIYVYRYDRVSSDNLAEFAQVISLKQFWIEKPVYKPGETMRVNLLWGVEKHPPQDYSFSVFVLNAAGQAVAQNDAPPFGTNTTTWQPGDLKFDSHLVNLPSNLPPGSYQVGVKIYWYGDPTAPIPVNGKPYFILGTITIGS